MTTRRIDSLDGLRGVAALVVVGYHCLLLAPTLEATQRGHPPATAFEWVITYTPLRVLWAGQEAVWIFFVLSGFVLVRPYLAGRRLEVGRYYLRRFIRLYLPFFASFAVAVLLRAVPHDPVAGQSWWVVSHAAPVDTVGAVHTSVLVLGNKVDLDNVWWSLQWEVWFSVLLPIVVVVVLRTRRFAGASLVACVIASGLLPDLARRLGWDANMLTGALRYLPMFGVGVAMAVIESTLRERLGRLGAGRSALFVIVGVVALTATVPLAALGPHWGVSPASMRIVAGMLGVTGAAMGVAAALAVPQVAAALCHRWVHWLGERSYSLYLIHEPIIIAMAFAFSLRTLTWWSLPLGVILALVVTALFYRFVEGPTLQFLRRIPPTSASPAPSATMGI